MREQIRRNVSGDLKKMGVGAALVLLFIPLFVLAVIAKVFAVALLLAFTHLRRAKDAAKA